MPRSQLSLLPDAPVRRRILGAALRRVLMAFSLFVLLAGIPLAPAQDASSRQAADSGVFQILSAKNRVGTEKFQIRPAGAGWDAAGELELQGPGSAKVSETSSLRLDSTLLPTSYERIQKSPIDGKLVAQFGASETILEMTTTEEPYQQIFYLPRNDLVVLDTNFFHHFAVLLRLYDRAKGMAQPFNVFIPQEALPGTINLQYLTKESVTVGKETRELDHFQAVTDELQIEIWATPEGVIQLISIPQANLEVVRQ
ncbi:MAG: hypothetical protein HY316_04500 [Acidobacteria bacterium]|nr:hypothetical protein [Acidobacteriota bacterium]